MTDTAMYFNLP